MGNAHHEEKEKPMAKAPTTIRGVDHGRTIEVEGDLNLPEGQQVTVIVQPVLTPEEAIRRSFGAWAEDAPQLGEFLDGLRRDRQHERPEPGQ
jgi:hypothetical protein